MQSWISIVTAIGDLLTVAAAVTNLAAARAQARKNRRLRRRSNRVMKAITARYHAHQDTSAHPRRRPHR
jgi:hypothetical protein